MHVFSGYEGSATFLIYLPIYLWTIWNLWLNLTCKCNYWLIQVSMRIFIPFSVNTQISFGDLRATWKQPPKYIFFTVRFFWLFFLWFIDELDIVLIWHMFSVSNHYFKICYDYACIHVWKKEYPFVKTHGEKIRWFKICVLLQRSIDIVYWYLNLIKI